VALGRGAGLPGNGPVGLRRRQDDVGAPRPPLDAANMMAPPLVWNFEASQTHVHCGFSALVGSVVVWPLVGLRRPRWAVTPFTTGGYPVKKAALALALVVAALSLGGCFVGKGKAPAPIVTKG
jgi:hypothetical protein